MKRLWLCAALLAVTVGLCVLSLSYERRQIATLLDGLDRLETVYESDGAAAALEPTRAYCREYERRTRWFACFISHANLYPGEETVTLLPAILEKEDTGDFLLETARLRVHLTRLLSTERPSVQNVF